MTTEICGFLTIVAGTFLLHTTKDFPVHFGLQDEETVPILGGGRVAGANGTGLERSGSTGVLLGSVVKERDPAARERLVTAGGSGQGDYHSVPIDSHDSGNAASLLKSLAAARGGSGQSLTRIKQ